MSGRPVNPALALRLSIGLCVVIACAGLVFVTRSQGESDFRTAASILRASGWDTRQASVNHPSRDELLALPSDQRKMLERAFANGEASRFTNSYVEMADWFEELAAQRRSRRDAGFVLFVLGMGGAALAWTLKRRDERFRETFERGPS